jgi:hypothetical protein
MRFITSDSEIEVPEEFARESNVLKNMYSDLGDFPETLDMRTISGQTLRNMIEYYESTKSAPKQDVIESFFQAKDWLHDIVPMLIAADYLLYEKLYQDAIRFVAKKYQDLSIPELESYFKYQW